MSNIRHRLGTGDETDETENGLNHNVPSEEKQHTDQSSRRRLSVSKRHSKHNKKWKLVQSKRFMFVLGTIIGVLIAGYTAQSNDLVSLDMLPDLAFLDDLRDMLPRNIVKEASSLEKDHAKLAESFAVGSQLKKEGLGVNHPVVLIPGVISTGLESWGLTGTEECPSQHYFRKRLWGSWYMLRSMLLDKSCWLKHIMLDPDTGLDPPHFKMRAAQGMEAADFFVAGYWLWNKILENLASLGYDVNTMSIASYDWRVAYGDLEIRDGYFSKLKLQIEENLSHSGKKTVLVGHSMGSQVIFYFLKWVEAQGHGNGGNRWVNDHIDSFVDISGSILGTPKAIVALLSGEMKDTVQLNALAVYGLEQFFSRRERADLLRTFGGIASMLPKGGDAIWGNLESAPDDLAIVPDTHNDGITFGNFIRFTNPLSQLSARNLTISDSIDYLYSQTQPWFKQRVENQYSHGLARTRDEVEANEKDQSKWVNPLEVALPYAPDMKIYCFYGVGKPTERSYYYQEETEKNVSQLNITISQSNPNSIVLGQGDGTISIATHTMCHRWKDPGSKFNPAGIPIKVVEMLHQPDRLDIRGGAKTAEHVDILGRTELNELVLRVAAGVGEDIEEKIVSNINEWVWDIDLGEDSPGQYRGMPIPDFESSLE